MRKTDARYPTHNYTVIQSKNKHVKPLIVYQSTSIGGKIAMSFSHIIVYSKISSNLQISTKGTV